MIKLKHNYSIQYNNVFLRPLTEKDIENLRVWRNDKNNSKFLRQIPYITEKAQQEWYKKYIDNKNEICFAIEECDEIKCMVGSLSLYNFTENSAEFGKILIGDIRAHRKQVGYHATVAAIKIAFETLNLQKLVLEVYENNFSAIKIYEKAGFIKKYTLRTDNIGTAVLYSITAE